MKISNHLSAADVMLDTSVTNKRDLLELLSIEAAHRLGRTKQEVFDALQAREKLGSTALGKGVALPHAELAGEIRPIMLFARLRRAIDFDARDDEPVDLVFLALWPERASKGLIEAVAEICRTVREPHLLRQLRLAGAPEDVAQILGRQGEFGASEGAPPGRGQ